MVSKNEMKAIELFLSGNLSLKEITLLSDKTFARFLAKKILIKNYLAANESTGILEWIADEDFRTLALDVLKENVNNPRAADRWGEERTNVKYAKKIFAEAGELRAIVLPVVGEYIPSNDLTEDELKSLALAGNQSRILDYLETYGFNKAMAKIALKDFDPAGFPISLSSLDGKLWDYMSPLVPSEKRAKEILDDARDWSLATVVAKINHLTLANAFTALKRANSVAEAKRLFERIKKNPLVEKSVIVALEEIMANAAPEPGRPNAEQLAELKTVKAASRKRGTGVDPSDAHEMEISLLAYELPIQTKKAALERALKAEEAGEASDPFKVTELEGILEEINTYIRFNALRTAAAAQEEV